MGGRRLRSVRPPYHCLEERLGAHQLTGRLAAPLVEYVERCVKEAGLKYEDREPLTSESAFHEAEPPPAGNPQGGRQGGTTRGGWSRLL